MFSIVELEDAYISNPMEIGNSRPALYPSEASVEYIRDGMRVCSGKCMREAWYRNIGGIIPAKPKPGLMMKAHLGKWDEIGTINKWKEMGLWVANNTKFFQPTLVLSGELDAILKDPETGKLIGYECKTFYNFGANKEICGAKRDMIPGRPKDAHFLQAIVYRWEFRNTLDDYRLYYLERGDGHRVEFRVGFDTAQDGTHPVWWEQVPGKYWNHFSEGKVVQPFTIEDIHKRYQTLIHHVKTKTIPPRDYNKYLTDEQVEWRWEHGEVSKTSYEAWQKSPSKNPIEDYHCGYCSYSEQCAQDELTASI
jgi:hypothetical protein